MLSKYNRQLTELEDSLRVRRRHHTHEAQSTDSPFPSNLSQSKQLQIDDLLRKLDAKEGEVSRMMEEKDQELMILQEGMDTTLQQLNDLRLVSRVLSTLATYSH